MIPVRYARQGRAYPPRDLQSSSSKKSKLTSVEKRKKKMTRKQTKRKKGEKKLRGVNGK